jgi:hypothetical protein
VAAAVVAAVVVAAAAAAVAAVAGAEFPFMILTCGGSSGAAPFKYNTTGPDFDARLALVLLSSLRRTA